MKQKETPLKTEPQRHVVSLDGLRAIAIIAVWAIHAGVPGSSLGWLGVDLFFALSGFLITTLMLKEKEQSKSIDIPKFWGRRFLRLMPAYYLYVSFLCLLITLGHHPMTSSGGWSPQGYLASLWFYFNNFVPRGGFGQFDMLSIHLWSLALEEQFYFVWPVIFVFATRMRQSLLLPLTILFILFIIRPFISYFALLSLPYGRGVAILTGCIIALWIHDLRKKGPIPIWLVSPSIRFGWLILSLGLILALSITYELKIIEDEAIQRWFLPVLSIQFSIFIAMLWYGKKDWIVRLLSWTPLAYIGKISYGIYLYHMLAHYLTWQVLLDQINDWPRYPKMGLRLIVYGVLSVAIAAFSYHFYEKPFLRIKKQLR